MRIAVLAWGSLISNPGSLELASGFVPTGPSLPLEFSRVSRNRRLTLVIDPTQGAMCQTYVALSAFDELDPALKNLWVREGNNSGEALPQDIREHGRVGFVDRIANKSSGKAAARHSHAVEAIAEWIAANGYDAAIWTALDSNFHKPEMGGKQFSVDSAMRYLGALNTPEFGTSLNYFRDAPNEVQTPLRAAVRVRWPIN